MCAHIIVQQLIFSISRRDYYSVAELKRQSAKLSLLTEISDSITKVVCYSFTIICIENRNNPVLTILRKPLKAKQPSILAIH